MPEERADFEKKQLTCIRRRKQWRQELLVSMESPEHAQDQVRDSLLLAVSLVDSTLSKKGSYSDFSKPCYQTCFDLPVLSALC